MSSASNKSAALPLGDSSILIVSGDNEATHWATLLAGQGFRILRAYSTDEAMALFSRNPDIAVVAADLDSKNYDAIDLIESLREQDGGPDSTEYVLIAAGNATVAALRAIKLQILDILIKPVDDDTVITAISDAVNVARMKRFQREEAHALETSLAEFKMRTHAAISHLIAQAQGAYNIAPPPLAWALLAATPDKRALQSFIAEENERARLREKVFGALVQNHAVWILLLALWDAQQAGTELTVKSAAYAAGLPLSSALRKINEMCADGLVSKRGDPEDARRSFVALTPLGQGYFTRFFSVWNGGRDDRRAAAG